MTAIDKLEGDLLTQVLIRVQEPRSRCHCKLVCKQWNSLLSDPDFVRSFDSHHQSAGESDGESPLMLKDSILSFIPVPDAERRRAFKIFDSFKDLLLCGFGCQLCDPVLERSFLICNPTTKQWISLPVAPEKPEGSSDPVARLVCEPRSSGGGNHGYRFRVVHMYRHIDHRYGHPTRFVDSIRLDVFCSESGGWIEKALVLQGYSRMIHKNVVCSCNGRLFWCCEKVNGLDHRPNFMVVAINPFRLDIPPILIDTPPAGLLPRNPSWNISVSQDALHVIVFESYPRLGVSRNLSSVWRLEEDYKSWSSLHQGWLNLNTSRFKGLNEYFLHHIRHVHPDKSEIVFLEFQWYPGHSHVWYVILSFNLVSGEIDYFSNVAQHETPWTVFKPKVSCWPIPIPRYEKLRTRYDGSHRWLVQSSSNNKKARYI
ncbi:unnamed protein product [Linum tenue]|uniref:F-box protein At3g26010-like beta-propeller domain-containing protein n=1 Tax=Linum tenue TaxID=586396 RepID=A0AAV0IZM4_9ROSI|nr:unnamed protein product [Linum tenue]